MASRGLLGASGLSGCGSCHSSVLLTKLLSQTVPAGGNFLERKAGCRRPSVRFVPGYQPIRIRVEIQAQNSFRNVKSFRELSTAKGSLCASFLR